MFTDLISALTEFNADKSAAEVKKLLDSGVDPFEIIENGLMQAMGIVGSRFEEGTYFLPELLLAAKAVEACSAQIRPVLTSDQQHARGTIVVGTVAGDYQHSGKCRIPGDRSGC
jgi:5-methyltetrahydrofolate--homocysteine methyltransferase